MDNRNIPIDELGVFLDKETNAKILEDIKDDILKNLNIIAVKIGPRHYIMSRIEDAVGAIKLNNVSVGIIILNNIQTRMKYFGDIDVLTEEINNITKHVDIIKENAKLYGGVFRYFTIFDKNSYMYNLNVNNIRLRFDVAESGYVMKPFINESFNFLDLFKNNRFVRSGTENEIPNHIGWKKSELIKALSESEFFHENVTERVNQRGFIEYKYEYPNMRPKIVTIRKKRSFPIFDNVTKPVLELLYRHINNYNSINFRKLCAMDKIDDITMKRMLDKFNPTFLNGKYKDMNHREICSNFEDVREFLIEIPQASQDVLFQPGGRYAMNVEKKYNTFMGLENKEEEKIKELYIKYFKNCKDEKITRDDIIFDAIELGLVDQINRNMSKNKICEVIQKYIKSIHIVD